MIFLGVAPLLEFIDELVKEEEEEAKCFTCDGEGIVTQNAGYCGGCERCGSTEEKEVECPDCEGTGKRN